jgi:Holliday junction DNA helicase RuvA
VHLVVCAAVGLVDTLRRVDDVTSMIGFLSGTIQFADLDAVCVNAGGVGYLVHMPLPDVARHSHAGTKVEVFVHTHVREDAIVLYGFSTRAGLSLFQRLTSVQGVGPRTALALLSGLEADALVRAIAEGDEGRLTKVPGVGKKTAARILLELGEKLAKESLSSGLAPRGGPLDDLRSALANLGYKAPQIERALQKIRPLTETGADLSTLVREALKHVS